jgi:hypothetical protein
LSFRAEYSDEDLNFKVIDPPRVPTSPIGPNPLLLFTGVLFAGFAAGVGLVIFLQQISPTITDWKNLNKVTGLPVFGMVSMSVTAAERRREITMLLLFSLAVLGLFAAYAAVVATQVFNVAI